MLNGAQIHLALNHLPVVGVMMGLLVLILGYGIKHTAVKRTGLALVLFASLSALPAYFSGEPAEEIVEHKPGVTKHDIHEHEESAELALVFSMIGGAAAGISLLAAWKRKELESKLTATTSVISVATAALMINAAHLGGMIRHDELRPASSSTATAPAEGNHDSQNENKDQDEHEDHDD